MSNKDCTDRLKNYGCSVYVNFTGGGSKFLSDLMVEGCSSYFCGASVEYDSNLFVQKFGEVDKFVSKETAKLMAQEAFDKIQNKTRPIGIGITAKMAYDGQREGRVNSFCVCFKGRTVFTEDITFDSSNREEQEEELSVIVLDILNHIMGMLTSETERF